MRTLVDVDEVKAKLRAVTNYYKEHNMEIDIGLLGEFYAILDSSARIAYSWWKKDTDNSIPVDWINEYWLKKYKDSKAITMWVEEMIDQFKHFNPDEE